MHAPLNSMFGDVVAGHRSATHEASIANTAKQLAQAKQVECPLTHHFSPGIYCREIFMPAGTLVIGHIHKTQHLNIILSGSAAVLMEGQVHYVQAPAVIESNPGVQKVLLIEEDMRWITVHTNPSDSKDIRSIEESLIELDEDTKQLKGSMTVDEFRMSVNDKIKQEVTECH
jgi:hypothetical protein